MDALEALRSELVAAAERSGSRQLLQAAGHVELAMRALLGPEGLERWPAVLVRDLAAAAGLDLAALVPAMGMLPPTESGVFASFAWDVHHENPVSDPEELGRRELTSYSVRGISWSPPKPEPNAIGSFTTGGARRAGARSRARPGRGAWCARRLRADGRRSHE